MKKLILLIALAVVGVCYLSFYTKPESNDYPKIHGDPIEVIRERYGSISGKKNARPKLAIAFGGGGVRGFMHLGVIKGVG